MKNKNKEINDNYFDNDMDFEKYLLVNIDFSEKKRDLEEVFAIDFLITSALTLLMKSEKFYETCYASLLYSFITMLYSDIHLNDLHIVLESLENNIIIKKDEDYYKQKLKLLSQECKTNEIKSSIFSFVVSLSLYFQSNRALILLPTILSELYKLYTNNKDIKSIKKIIKHLNIYDEVDKLNSDLRLERTK